MGTEECRSSLPRVELRSEPAAFFLDDVGGPLGAARCRWESMSFLRFCASSLFSSVNLRNRSWFTQSSHLRQFRCEISSNHTRWLDTGDSSLHANREKIQGER